MPNLAALSPSPRLQFFDSNGIPLAGGKLFTYSAGTSLQLATFTDSTEAANNTNPVILDSTGAASVWLGASFYRFVLQDSNSVQIFDIDNISSSNLPFITNFSFLEGATQPGVPGSDLLYGLSSRHRLAFNNNNTGEDVVVGENTTDTLAHKTLTGPIIHGGTIDAPTFSGIASGTFNFIGTTSLRNINTIQLVDQQPGATADAQFVAAMAVIPNGGILDARGYGATGRIWAAHVNIGSATVQYTVLLDRATQFSVTVNSGLSAITLWSGSAIVAAGTSNPIPNTGGFNLAPGANVASILNFSSATSEPIVGVHGITLRGNATATVTNGLIDVLNLTDQTTISDIIVWDFTNTVGILVRTAANIALGPINFTNVTVNGLGNTGARPVQITTSGNGELGPVNFIGGSLTHPGPGGLSIVDIQGPAASSLINGINFFGTQFESSSGADIGINCVNCFAIHGVGLIFTAGSGGAGTSCIKISNSGGITGQLTFDNITNYNAWANTIQDAINSVNITEARLVHYTYLPPVPSVHSNDTYGSSGLVMGRSNLGLILGKPIITYNGLTTVGNGVPSELAQISLTAQTALIAATTLYTPLASGKFRISAYLKVTTVAGTSSTLGAVTITFTDPTDSVAQSQVIQMQTEAGASATTNAGNLTTSKLSGTLEIEAKIGVPIQYAIAYASNAAAAMNYKASLTLEAI